MPKSKSKEQRAKSKKAGSKIPARRLEQPTYKSFRLSKRIKQPKTPLKGSFRLFVASVSLVKRNWRLFGAIAIIYALLTAMLVKGFGVNTGLEELKDVLEGVGKVTTALALFTNLLSNANTVSSEVASAYQSMLLVVGSLASIWALRQAAGDGKTKIRVKDAFYKGMAPLVPFLLVLLVIGLQLLPLVVAGFLYGVVFGGGLAITALEQVLWGSLLFCFGLLSLYMITSSVFALYIVTLPNVTPLAALRSARDLVRHRRWNIMRKVVFLPFALLVLAAIVMVPAIIISAFFAEWLFLVLNMLVLPLVHSYMYTLYRELIKE